MSVNPYLHAAGIAAAGLAGLERGEEPPAPAAGNLFDASDPAIRAFVEAAPRLPSDLGEVRAAPRDARRGRILRPWARSTGPRRCASIWAAASWTPTSS